MVPSFINPGGKRAVLINSLFIQFFLLSTVCVFFRPSYGFLHAPTASSPLSSFPRSSGQFSIYNNKVYVKKTRSLSSYLFPVSTTSTIPSKRLSSTCLYNGRGMGSSGAPCSIKVLGVGGAGGNAVNRMIAECVNGVEFWAINTDAQALKSHTAENKLIIGNAVTRGLGAGGIPDVGRQAAEESRSEIATAVSGADLVFVTAGMGGGTGSGAAPIVAEVAKEMGALTIGVVTKPFLFEGRRRMNQANHAIDELSRAVDTLIVVSNDKLLQIIEPNTPLDQSFKVADDILRNGVVGITEIIVRPGVVNVDFADVRSVMGNAGTALMGMGEGSGKNRAIDAAAEAISSPLLEFPVKNAKGIVFNIMGGPDMSLPEINNAAEYIYENVDQNANIIFGALIDESLGDKVRITVLATGFDSADKVMNTMKAAEVKQQQNEQAKERMNETANGSIQRQTGKEKVSRTIAPMVDNYEEDNYLRNVKTNTARKKKIRNHMLDEGEEEGEENEADIYEDPLEYGLDLEDDELDDDSDETFRNSFRKW